MSAPLKLALVIPGTGDVPAAFAHDLARVVGHLARHSRTEVRLLATDVADPSPELRDQLLRYAREWGADVIVFPNPATRMPAHAFDKMLDEVARPKIILPGEVN